VAHGDQVWGVKEVERQAHFFAAAFLMPAEEIAHELPTRADWQELFDLKRKWQVSLGALLMRARALDVRKPVPDGCQGRLRPRMWRVEPISLGQPEEPVRFTRLLTVSGAQHAATLPADILEGLTAAT
jgi:uncharacterized protein DUF955